jgi:hypothetical protein
MDVGDLESMFCSEKTGYVFLEHHPVESEPVDTSCLKLKGATRSRFDQRIRGGHIDVWLVGLPETEPTT